MQLFFDNLYFTFDNIYFVLFLGLIFGSFLNVVINRIPEGKSVVFPSSSCPKCKYVLKWYDNIPIFSWILLRGKCRKCHLKISIQYPLIEFLSAILLCFIYSRFGFTFHFFLYGMFYFALFAISIIDLKTYSVSTSILNFLLGIALVLIGLSLFQEDFLIVKWYEGLLGGGIGFFILFLMMFIGRKIYKQEAMGGGDLFIFAYGSLILGVKLMIIAFILSCSIAILAYCVPWLYSLFKKKEYLTFFLDKAKYYEAKLKNSNESLFLKGLKGQLDNQIKNADFSLTKEEYSKLTKNDYLIYFFRFMAMKKTKEADKMLRELDSNFKNNSLLLSSEDILNQLDIYFVGYGNLKDNLALFKERVKVLNLDNLLPFITPLEEKVKEELKIPDFAQEKDNILNIVNNFQSIDLKQLKYLLKLNKLWQYGGYVKEQKFLADNTLANINLLEYRYKIFVLTELYLVYYTDFYYKHAAEILVLLESELAKNENILDDVPILFYNLALYRGVFYHIRLAFGPYLALGIFLSHFFGNMIFSLYLEFLNFLNQ